MSKEKSTVELNDEKQQLITRSKAITETAKGEKRMLKEDETTELGGIQCRMVEINMELRELEEKNRGKRTPKTTQKRFSLRRALANYVTGQAQDESESAVIESATEFHNKCVSQRASSASLIIPVSVESRAMFTAANESATGVVIDQEQQEMLLPLQSQLVLVQAGARYMTGLQGDIYWPKYSGANVFWEGENTASKDGAGEFSKGTAFKPKRLTAYVDISEQLLIQENTSVESIVRQALATAIAQKVEQTAFGVHAHNDNTPDGLFQKVPAINGVMDWGKLVELETNADMSNALYGNLAYLMHPALVGKAKTKVKDSSGAGGFIFGETGGAGTLNGYRSLRTNNLPKGLQTAKDEYGIIFGNWNDYFIGQWGALEIKIDPYTQALNGVVRLIVNSYWNMGMIRNESFSIASMK